MPVFHESIKNIALGRVLHSKESNTVQLTRDKHCTNKVQVDIARPLFYSDHNSVTIDLERVSRIKPFYRRLTNASQPFTYPDGKPIGGIKVTFQLCDLSQRAIQATDYDTGDTIVGLLETWTDEFGEINEYIWPNGRSLENTFYAFHIDVPGMDDAMLYIPDHNSVLDFKIPWSNRNKTYLTNEKSELGFSVTPVISEYDNLECSITIN